MTRTLEFMRDLGETRYTVVAHDTGGTIARLMAAMAPDDIAHLILLNTEIPNHRPPFIPSYQKTSHLPGMRYLQNSLVRQRWFQRSAAGYGGCFFDPSFIDAEFISKFGTYWTKSPVRYRELMRYLRGVDFNVIDDLDNTHSKIRCPVSFIWGENDPTFPIDLGRAMALKMPTLRNFHAVPETRFLPHEEKPDRVATLILEEMD